MTSKETSITNGILSYLKKLPNCFAFKEHGGYFGEAGIPDVICCYRGKFIAFEVKRPGEEPTKLQVDKIKRIQKAGGEAYVVFSKNDVKQIIESKEC